MMRALVEHASARKAEGLLDVVVSRVATRMVDALAARLEPLIAETVERCLTRSGRLLPAPGPGDEQARDQAVSVEEGPFSSSSDTERTGSHSGQKGPFGTAPFARSCGSASVGTPATSRVVGAPSTLRSNVDAKQRTS